MSTPSTICRASSTKGCARVRPPPRNLTVVADADEGTVIDVIDEAAARTPFVVIDLEGTASMMVSYAISRSDFVIIPTQGSQLDARQAARAIRLVQQQEKAFRRRIPHAVLLTRTSAAIRPRSLRHIHEQLIAHNVDIFAAQLIERDAFRALFSFGGTLHELDDRHVSNLKAAKANAHAFAAEVIEKLRLAERQGRGTQIAAAEVA
ncbi:MAG: ParA family protein [Rhodospirillales bacterium]|nr:ParA family protein [Rhodospirillales bacterium]